jgi:hypothetical protein
LEAVAEKEKTPVPLSGAKIGVFFYSASSAAFDGRRR